MTDYTWKVMRSPNPNKAWVVKADGWVKLSAIMSSTSAEKICIAHNMQVKYLQQQSTKDIGNE